MKKLILNGIKGAGIAVSSILLLLFILPVLFPGTVAKQIKTWTNRNIDGRLNFSEIGLSFFRHFPALTLTLHDFSLTGAAPFANDTLLAGKALGFGIDLSSVFGKTLKINAFYIDDARINVQIDKQGRANYNVYKGGSTSEPDSSNTQLKVEGIFLNRCQLTYNDRSLPMRVEAENLRYEGRGDLANSQFDLQSKLQADQFDFVYDGTPYFLRRKLKADLVTGINTASLVFRFAKNNLLINKLPVDFSGDMAILKDGYDIDLNVVSGTTDFGNIFSALPPEYDAWFADTKFGGQSQITVSLKGHYRAATAEAPDLSVKLWVHDGLIRHKKAPAPLEHFWLNGTVQMPGLDPEALSLTVDTLRFELNGAPTRASFQVKGLSQPYLKAHISSQIDLALLDSAAGLSMAELQGRLRLDARADGYYRTAVNRSGKHPDTVITGIPAYQLDAGIQNGYVRYRDLELPLRDVQLHLSSDCPSGKWQEIALQVDSFHAALGEGFVDGKLRATGLEPSNVTARLKANLKLEDLARAMPLQGYAFGGALLADFEAEGLVEPAKQRFPLGHGTLQWKNGLIRTPWYPHPIEQIDVEAHFVNMGNTYENLSVNLNPVSFRFEQQPFSIQGELTNPANLKYRLRADGTLDLGKIYQVFAVSGYGLSGLLHARLDLQGAQADALAGRYQLLRNKGTLRLANLELHSDDYPDPFYLPGSTLRFEDDKAWLTDTRLRYRKNEFTLNGYAQNLIGYALGAGPLSGQLTVSSPRVVVDDFMAFSKPATAAKPAAKSPPAGVVLLPADMDLTLEARADEVLFGQTKIQHFGGQLALQKGNLLLKKTQLNIAGATIGMEGNYTPVNARKALFGFAFKADSFDVQRAYAEIPLFREMASSAEKASGQISVEYQLQGRLNDRMEPVYPSIKGKGFVKLEHVKVSGLKLFGAVSKATGKDEIDNPDLKAVVIKSSIANNIITIERTKMKVLGFRPRIEGQSSLDGRLNLRFRLGLPPFGLLGIPMTITGTSENPVVEIRKGKEADELDEQSDEADEEQ